MVGTASAAAAYGQYYKYAWDYGYPTFGGIAATIKTPPSRESLGTQTGTVKACLATKEYEGGHTLQLGWIYRPGWSYPKTFYIYQRSDALGFGNTPTEILLGDQAWNKAINFEIKLHPSEKNDRFDLKINGNVYKTTLALNPIPMSVFHTYYFWNNQTYYVGSLGSVYTNDMWSYFYNVQLYSARYGTWVSFNTGYAARTAGSWDISGTPPAFYVTN